MIIKKEIEIYEAKTDADRDDWDWDEETCKDEFGKLGW